MALLQSPEARLERESCAQECNADLCVVPVLFVSQVRGFWPAVAIIALATAAHQGWSCNMFTLASDMFSAARHRESAEFGGAGGGLCIAWLVGRLLQWTDSYAVVLFMTGSAYLFALLLVHLLAPRLEPVYIDYVTADRPKNRFA
jgi:MFS transporter, ACS family, hexuronate transporter